MTSSIDEIISKFRSDLDIFDEDMEKYDYIIEYGDKLDELHEIYRQPIYQVMGCQSKLWIRDFGDNTLEFKAYSEAKIVRGLTAMILEIYNGKTKQEILATDPKILNNLGIASLLTPGRQNGVGNLITKIYEIANKRSDN
jgi:cysteine desulfuration protein SufE